MIFTARRSQTKKILIDLGGEKAVVAILTYEDCKPTRLKLLLKRWDHITREEDLYSQKDLEQVLEFTEKTIGETLTQVSLCLPHSLCHNQTHLKKLIFLFNQKGIMIESIFDQMQESATRLLSLKAKQEGCALLDIGHFSSQVRVLHGLQSKSFRLPVGGYHMSKDLQVGLSVNNEQADRAKKILGLSAGYDQGGLILTTINGKEEFIQWRDVFSVLAPRIREFAFLLAKRLIQYKGRLSRGIFLTGGSAAMPGLDELLADQLRIPVERLDFNLHEHQPQLVVEIFGDDQVNLSQLQLAQNPFSLQSCFSGILALCDAPFEKPLNSAQGVLRKIGAWIKELA